MPKRATDLLAKFYLLAKNHKNSKIEKLALTSSSTNLSCSYNPRNMKMMNFCTDVCPRACVRDRETVCLRACELGCLCVCVRAGVVGCLCVCVCASLDACVYACVRAWMPVCMRACELGCLCVCVRVCVCNGGRLSWIFPRVRFAEAPVAYPDIVSAPSIRLFGWAYRFFVLIKPLRINWFLRPRFCGRARNLEITIIH